jgi:phenylalanyl-tRNA synthetase alpha subunit
MLVGKGVVKDENESGLIVRAHATHVDLRTLIKDKLLELDALKTRKVIRDDVGDNDELHVHNSERVVFDERVEARGVVECLWLGHSRPASLCVHVR